MGTNYYLHAPACSTCGRGDEPLHICKNLTMFQGHFTWDDDGDWHPWLTSWVDWRRHLRTAELAGATIRDEYGHTFTAQAFTHSVGRTLTEDRRRQFDAVAAHPMSGLKVVEHPEPGGVWLDADGFSFTGGEFT